MPAVHLRPGDIELIRRANLVSFSHRYSPLLPVWCNTQQPAGERSMHAVCLSFLSLGVYRDEVANALPVCHLQKKSQTRGYL